MDLCDAVVNYTVTVHTGQKPLAGTDAKAYVVLYGEYGETEELYLDQQGQDLFESGAFVLSHDTQFQFNCRKINVESASFGTLVSAAIE